MLHWHTGTATSEKVRHNQIVEVDRTNSEGKTCQVGQELEKGWNFSVFHQKIQSVNLPLGIGRISCLSEIFSKPI